MRWYTFLLLAILASGVGAVVFTLLDTWLWDLSAKRLDKKLRKWANTLILEVLDKYPLSKWTKHPDVKHA
jgi:hypothetical protein